MFGRARHFLRSWPGHTHAAAGNRRAVVHWMGSSQFDRAGDLGYSTRCWLVAEERHNRGEVAIRTR